MHFCYVITSLESSIRFILFKGLIKKLNFLVNIHVQREGLVSQEAIASPVIYVEIVIDKIHDVCHALFLRTNDSKETQGTQSGLTFYLNTAISHQSDMGMPT